MFYTRPDSRNAFHDDAADLFARALETRSNGSAKGGSASGATMPEKRPTP
jgi:hypothetical protein